MKRFGLLLLLVTSTVFSQPKVWVNLKGDSLHWSPNRAAFMYFQLCEEAARETTILVYIKQGFYWKAPLERVWGLPCDARDSCWTDYTTIYHFTIDSIIGRGDQRKALFSWARKACNDSGWIWIVEKLGDFVQDPNKPTGNGFAPRLFDTLGRTTDSTFKVSRWLTYSRKLLDPISGGWYIYSGMTPVVEWCDVFEGNSYRWYVWIRMEKILGDPTKNFGWDQRAVLKMRLYQGPNDSLYRAVVGDVSTW
jgi:hypothetical protein